MIISVTYKKDEFFRLSDFFDTNEAGIQVLVVYLAISIGFGLLVFALNTYLIGLHIWLKKHKLSTYQYILILRKKKAEVFFNQKQRQVSPNVDENLAEDSMKEYFEPYIDIKNSIEDTTLIHRNPNILKFKDDSEHL